MDNNERMCVMELRNPVYILKIFCLKRKSNLGLVYQQASPSLAQIRGGTEESSKIIFLISRQICMLSPCIKTVSARRF